MERRKLRLVIEQDQFSDDPRSWDNLGTMLCCNRNYQLGDCNSNRETEGQLAETCRKDDCDWKAEAKKILEAEITRYSQFLEGDVQQYTLYEETIVTRKTRDGKILSEEIAYDEMVDSMSGLYDATLEDVEEYLPIEIAEIEEIDD